MHELFEVIGAVTVVVILACTVVYIIARFYRFYEEVRTWRVEQERNQRAEKEYERRMQGALDEITLLQNRICELEAELVVYKNGGPYRVAGSTGASLVEDEDQPSRESWTKNVLRWAKD